MAQKIVILVVVVVKFIVRIEPIGYDRPTTRGSVLLYMDGSKDCIRSVGWEEGPLKVRRESSEYFTHLSGATLKFSSSPVS